MSLSAYSMYRSALISRNGSNSGDADKYEEYGEESQYDEARHKEHEEHEEDEGGGEHEQDKWVEED